ncbi:YncE family protein [Williamsia deligens]|uniref:YncE family protein n=1 Tax=Williamsia deligens TaxID=321325 RepID=A0ABW3G8R1_9NOCA|nr:Ig-like domain-containing protein [Williamsia deligens]MCP2192770.1 DNA-binding beta-propeller fold protein YncE [Williamsia deligens]
MHNEVMAFGGLNPSAAAVTAPAPLTTSFSLVSAPDAIPVPTAGPVPRARWSARRRQRDAVPVARRVPAIGGVRGRITTGTDDGTTLTVTSVPHRGTVTVSDGGEFTYLPWSVERTRVRPGRPVVDVFRAVVDDDRDRRSAVAVAAVVTSASCPWPLAYTANAIGSTTVTVDEHPRGVALSADGAVLYTLSSTASSLTAIDTGTMTVLGSLSLIGRPTDLAHDHSTGRLYVTLTALDLVEIVDMRTFEVVDAIGVDRPRAIAVVPGRAVLIATVGGDLVAVSVVTHDVLAVTAGCGLPRTVRVTADGRTAVVLDESGTDARLHRVRSPLADPHRAGVFRADGFVFDVALTADGTRAHLVEDGTRSLMTVDVATMTSVAATPLESFHTGVAVSTDGRWVYVCGAFDDCVRLVDTETGAVVSSVETGEFARDVAIGTDGRAYVTSSAGVSVVGGALCGSIVADDRTPCRFTLTAAPAHGTVEVTEDGAFVYVPSRPLVDGDSFTVSVEDGRHAPVAAIIPVITGLPGTC